MNQYSIRKALPEDFQAVLSFYDAVIDNAQHLEYGPAWKKGIYPTEEYLKGAVDAGEYYIADCGKDFAAGMILNHSCNEGYADCGWQVAAQPGEVSVIHTLAAAPEYLGKGAAKAMVAFAIDHCRKQGQKAIRLDVLSGNLPAERLYLGMGFRHIARIALFYEDTGSVDFELLEFLLSSNVEK